MASTTKKGSRKTKAKPRRPVAKKSQPKQTQTNRFLQQQLDESLAREAATSAILRMIARSATTLQLAQGDSERRWRLFYYSQLNKMAVINSDE